MILDHQLLCQTQVIWPYLADSIAMAVVESAMEEVDNAMEDYADRAALEHMWFLHGKQASSVWLKLTDLQN